MSENKDLTSSAPNHISATSSGGVFSEWTRDAAMNVISIAEIRKVFMKRGSDSQGIIAFAKNTVCTIFGIEFEWSLTQAQKADKLVKIHTAIATNNPSYISEEPKKAA
jgi:hypothetical protein